MEIKIPVGKINEGIETLIYWIYCVATLGLLAVLRITITKAIRGAEK